MNKYLVRGTTTVVVSIEVEAENEIKAYEVASEKLSGLSSYCGNGGTDKIIGVDGNDESRVSVDENIEYDDIELLEKDIRGALEKVIEIAGQLEWTVTSDEMADGCVEIEFRKYSPAGEDFSFSIVCDEVEEIADEVEEFYEDFDCDEHAAMWYQNKDAVGGVPQSLSDLFEDAKAIKCMIEELADAISEVEDDNDDEA